jgi:hypothetical protein
MSKCYLNHRSWLSNYPYMQLSTEVGKAILSVFPMLGQCNNMRSRLTQRSCNISETAAAQHPFNCEGLSGTQPTCRSLGLNPLPSADNRVPMADD